MKILIVYDSGKGTVKTAVERMLRPLENLDVTTVSLNEKAPDPADYDLVVVGGSVRFGKLRANARKYLTDHEKTLMQKALGLFFCCGLTEEQDYYAEKIFPKSLQAVAFHIAYFGGSLNSEGLPFFDRMIVKSMRSSLLESEISNGNYIADLPYILPENIDDMGNAILAKANEMLKAERA